MVPDAATISPGHPGVMNENDTPPVATPVKKFYRSRDDRMIAGVCGGAAKMLGVDTAVVRIALLAATVLGVGSGLLVYLICWMIIPEEP